MPTVLGFAFFGTQNLLTVARPKRFAADFTGFLLECVIAFFGKSSLLQCNSICFVATFSGAILLSVSVRIERLVTVLTNTLSKFVTAVFFPTLFLLLCLTSLVSFSLSLFLSFQLFSSLFCGLCLCFRKFRFGVGEFKLTDKIEVNINLLFSVRFLAHGFVNNDFINQFHNKLSCQLCGILVFLDDGYKAFNINL